MDEPSYDVQSAYIQSFESSDRESTEILNNTLVFFNLIVKCKRQWIELPEADEATTAYETRFTLLDCLFEVDLPSLQDEDTTQQRFQRLLASRDYLTLENLNFLKVEIASRARIEANRSILRSSNSIIECFYKVTIQVVTRHYYEHDAVTIRIMNHIRGLRSIKGLQIKKPEEVEIDQTCSVCLDQLSLGKEEVAEMPCAHVFHRRCIVPWLERKKTCPLCRFQISN